MSCLESFKMMANGVSKFLSFSLQLYYRAISQTSVDFGGPFYTKKGKGKNRHKRSLCSFTCLATREVHLDAAYGLILIPSRIHSSELCLHMAFQ